MVDPRILELIKDRTNGELNSRRISEEILQNPGSVTEVISALGSEDEELKTNCADILKFLSEEHPSELYPYVHVFLENLGSEEPEVRCHAMDTLGNLASIDKSNKITGEIKEIGKNLSSDNEYVQYSSVRALGKIAAAHPASAERIFNMLISHKKFFPDERIGMILESFHYFSRLDELREDARRFTEQYIQSGPPSVKDKAMDVLRKL